MTAYRDHAEMRDAAARALAPTVGGLDAVREVCADMRATVAERVPEIEADLINHPPHYTGHPSGVECIQITEHMGFCLGNALKYIWRAGLKGDNAVEDLEKAGWYIAREIARLTR